MATIHYLCPNCLQILSRLCFSQFARASHNPESDYMNAHRIETVINQDRTLLLKDLPFQAGESVEVIVLQRSSKPDEKNRYPLRGTQIQYIDPTEPVAQDDWNASK
jgi:hypothetical protein